MEALFFKDPDAYLDYAVDWSTWVSSAENITTYSITVNSSLITVATYSQSGNVVTAWLSGGVVGQTYTVSVKITTDGARVDERSFKLKIKQR
jgi:hypothetical protein